MSRLVLWLGVILGSVLAAGCRLAVRRRDRFRVRGVIRIGGCGVRLDGAIFSRRIVGRQQRFGFCGCFHLRRIVCSGCFGIFADGFVGDRLLPRSFLAFRFARRCRDRAGLRGDLEAADAYGLAGWTKFRRVVWPTMLRLAWPSYTNEAIFLFHATTLVFFSGFPAFQQRGDSLYYATYFADKTFNPFVAYPIVAGYFVLFTLILIGLFGMVNRRLNQHLPGAVKRLKYRPQLVR